MYIEAALSSLLVVMRDEAGISKGRGLGVEVVGDVGCGELIDEERDNISIPRDEERGDAERDWDVAREGGSLVEELSFSWGRSVLLEVVASLWAGCESILFFVELLMGAAQSLEVSKRGSVVSSEESAWVVIKVGLCIS